MKPKSYDSFFANFSNRTKLAIVLCLRDGPRSVNEIVEEIGDEQSNVSHNLKNMAACGILKVKKDGKKRIYSLNKKTAIPILKAVEKHVGNYCSGNCRRCFACK